ncbi:neuferricin-like [Lineus longissimus]|uniref:neuferricin-like n=1 Tax=Lineus longissimus TaxID=88925 RepID=UPI002B4CF1F5
MLANVAIASVIIVGVFAIFLALPIFAPFIKLIKENAPFFIREYFLLGRNIQESSVQLFTKDELADYDGTAGSKGLYVAVLGKVFDVSAGKQHYGPGGSYHYFAGKDGTRGYVTGDFGDGALDDNVEDFTPNQMLQLIDWLSFYEKKTEYKYIGKVIGPFYDSSGHQTRRLNQVIRYAKNEQKKEDASNDKKTQFPPCNSMWSHEEGSVVWCTTDSGGIKRDWAGVPRQYFEPGQAHPRCACVRDKGPPTGQWNSEIDRGDLHDPTLRPYTGCDERSPLCKLPES